jgi:cell division protease FtsH
MHLLAKYLLKYEKIDGDDFEKLMRNELIVDVSDIPDEIPPYEKADIDESNL